MIAIRIWTNRVWSPLLFSFFVVACIGCGTGTGDVTGTVTYKDKPLPGGTVTFLDAGGTFYQSEIQPDGTYEVIGVPVGEAKVAVTYVDEKINEFARDLSKSARGQQKGAMPKVNAKEIFQIPDQYSDHGNSGLTTPVTKGTSKFDIVLK